MAVASGNLDGGAMSLIRLGFQCDPRVVYYGFRACKIADRSKAMLEEEAPLLAEAQGQR